MKWIGRSSSGAFLRLIARRIVLISHLEYRLKKVQGKKKRDVAARESARAAEQVDKEVFEAHELTVDDEGGGDLLSSKDEDVIF
jgi:hypothetical protein